MYYLGNPLNFPPFSRPPAAAMEEYMKLIPSNASLVGAYSSFSTSWVLFKTAYNQIIPKQLQQYLISKLSYYFSLFGKNPSYANFIIEDLWSGLGRNQLYDAAQAYLSTKIGPDNRKIKVGKLEQQKTVSVAISEGVKVVDIFQGIPITWSYVQEQQQNGKKDGSNSYKPSPQGRISSNNTYYLITFDNKYWEKVQNDYLIHVLETYKAFLQKDKAVKLYTRYNRCDSGGWKPIEFHHPATFYTLAMDFDLKKSIIEDLDRFLARKEFYRDVGKAWKRGYLLYGPPGTGKSSLVAAMANYLKFDIYDLELNSIGSNAELRRVLLNTTNRSILVVEDIDCSSEVHDRSKVTVDEKVTLKKYYKEEFTLSTLLNCIDGLWSSCGEARIIVFTTNRKEVLDPALLRPGRMDMHIHMSYCTPQGFRVLALNYLKIHDHKLYQEIDDLVKNTKATPAAVAEELMKSNDPDISLTEVVNFLKRKQMEDEEDEHEMKNKKQKTT